MEEVTFVKERKTMLQDLLEKYPNALLNRYGVPIDICPDQLGHAKSMGCSPGEGCVKCWNRPLTDK